MMIFGTHRRAFAFAPILAAAALMTACDDDPVEPPDPAEAVEIVRLTIGDGTFDLDSDDTENITLPADEPVPVEAEFLDADSVAVGGLEDEFELNLVGVEGSEGDVTWVRDATDPFAGTLTVEADAIVAVQLFHVEEGHEDLETRLNVTVE